MLNRFTLLLMTALLCLSTVVSASQELHHNYSKNTARDEAAAADQHIINWALDMFKDVSPLSSDEQDHKCKLRKQAGAKLYRESGDIIILSRNRESFQDAMHATQSRDVDSIAKLAARRDLFSADNRSAVVVVDTDTVEVDGKFYALVEVRSGVRYGWVPESWIYQE
jgi:hypothetical protein